MPETESPGEADGIEQTAAPVPEGDLTTRVMLELEQHSQSTGSRVREKLALAALGAVPWVGPLLSSLATLKTEEGQLRVNELMKSWMAAHQEQLASLLRDLDYLAGRIDAVGEEAQARAESPDYLQLVRKAFQSWDRADTDEKRQYYARLLANAAGSTLCPDDTVRLFIAWIDRYHESHFRIIRFVYQHRGCTRHEIGLDLFGTSLPLDSSAEADLFRELYHELNLGRIVRQVRATDSQGRFIRESTSGRPRRTASPTLESAFEPTKPVELTELGRQFVHYVLNEAVGRIEGASP